MRSALRDVPAALRDPSRGGGATSAVATALGAILSGEPRRALAVVADHEAEASRPEVAALAHLASVLDRNWWPGDTGAVQANTTPDLPGVALTASGDLRTDLHLLLAAQTVPALLSLRSIVRSGSRVDPSRAWESVRALAEDVESLLRAAAKFDVAAAADLAADLADLYRLAGAQQDAEAYLGWSREAYSRLGDPCGTARCQLLMVDWVVAPATFTDTLGFDLEDLAVERHVPRADEAYAARRAYREARRSFRNAHCDRGVAATLRSESCLDLLSGQRPLDVPSARSAERRLRLATAYARRGGDTAAAMLAEVSATIAAVAAGRLSAATTALADEVVRWAQGPGSASYGAGLARLLHASGQAWRRRGDVERARVCLALALEMSQRLSGPSQVREVLGDQAELYGDLNSRGPAIASYARALAERLEAAGGLDAVDQLDALAWLELVDLVSGSFKILLSERDPDGLSLLLDVAHRLLARAPAGAVSRRRDSDLLERMAVQEEDLAQLRARRTVPTSLDAAADPGFEASALALTAESLHDVLDQVDVMEPLFRARRYQHDGDDDLAAALFSTAVERARKRGTAARSLLVVALQATGRFREAQAVVESLLAAAPATSATDQLSLWASARGFRQAAMLVTPALDGATSPDWRDLSQWGRVLAETGSDDRAATLLGVARDRFEERFARLTRDAFLVSATDDAAARDLYAVSAAVAGRDGRVADSLALGDRLRSFALDPLLAGVGPQATQSPAQSTALRRWGRASAAWTGAYDVLAAASFDLSADATTASRASLDSAQADLDLAEHDLEQATPDYLVRQHRPRAPIRVQDVQSLLTDDTLLVEYLVSWDRFLVWAVSGKRVVFHDLPYAMPRLSGAARRFHDSCARGRLSTDDDARLAEVLLDPVADLLRDHERVVLVPSGPLALVPFAALPFGGDVLGANHVVSFLPSASALLHLAGRPGGSTPDLARPALVVGDPAYDPRRGLCRLPGARAEARQVAARYGVEPLLDVDATAERVSRAIGEAGIIHLATHGLVRADAPTLSCVALAGMDELTVADLIGLRLDADVVVLSACDTGRGDVTLGGDVVGLVRGLMAAGARHAVVSLWPVDDVATSVLMDVLAAELAHGAGVADALSRASRAVRTMSVEARAGAVTPDGPKPVPGPSGLRRSARDARPQANLSEPGDEHPYWWAPFVHVGL